MVVFDSNGSRRQIFFEENKDMPALTCKGSRDGAESLHHDVALELR